MKAFSVAEWAKCLTDYCTIYWLFMICKIHR
jgi:hypothetical protein